MRILLKVWRGPLAAFLLMQVGCHPWRARAASSEESVDKLAHGFGPAVKRDLTHLRQATRSFHDMTAAQAAGYPTTTPTCVEDSTMGGMGRHYLDRAASDDSLDIAHPEMLIYAPNADGTHRFVAVEYIVPYRARPATATAPRLFGQEFRPHAQFQYWYLHVWAWAYNPAGLFSDWNPAVSCVSAP